MDPVLQAQDSPEEPTLATIHQANEDAITPNSDLQTEEVPQKDEEELEPSGLSKEEEDALLACYEYFRIEERGTRDVMIAFWKKLENYWQGVQRIFWDFSLQDWRRIPLDDSDDSISSLIDPTLYDKVINIYKAHGESIIAALSVKTPNVIFFPDDADVQEDVDTARAYEKIAQLICKHNHSPLLLIKSLFILFNQGMVASYIYNRESSEYGTVKIPQYGPDIQHNTHTLTCPICNQFIDEFVTRGDQEVPPVEEQCNNCGNIVEPVDTVTNEIIPQISGYSSEPKSRTMVDVFGPLYVHTAFYARKQSDIPYIHFNFEQHNALLRDYYASLKDKLQIKGNSSNSYDRWARSFNTQAFAGVQDLSTVTLQWLRPWAFEVLNDDQCALLKTKYPEGCYSVIINGNTVAEARPELLDDHWEISVNPLSNFLHSDPLGKVLAPIQEIQTEINDLKLETFEHAIPETFADPKVLDFKKYKETQARPGQMVPAKTPQGGTLEQGFHTIKPATLSDEISTYDQDMTSKGQFVSGAFPSIYGGPNSAGSKTAHEYSESQARALQRLGLTWTMLKFWWSGSVGKATRLYANSLLVDDKFVERSKESPSGFTNIFIGLAELTGEVGRVEPDIDEELPVSNSQVKDVLMQLLTLNNEEVNMGLLHPNNTPMIARALGAPEFYVPGKEDRDKQFSEISDILKGIPTDIDLDVDNHGIHIEVLKAWLAGPSGVALKKINPMGYQMLIMHLQAHIQAFQMTQPESGNENPGDTGASKDNKNVAQ